MLILAPTNASSLVGARIVRRDVLDQLVGEATRTFVVWTPMRADDTRDAAQKASNSLDTLDVEQFWDPSHSMARQYGQILDLPSHRVLAWNVYAVHGRSDEWKSGPPRPAAWMHQLGNDQRTLDGPTLLDLVTKEIKRTRPAVRKGKG